MSKFAKSLLILFFLALFGTGACLAQSRLLQQADFFELNEGLSNRLVKTIIRGRDQLIWIGTNNGLNRFDGYEFLVFNSDWDNPHQLSGSNIAALKQDKSGRIVVLYENITTNFDLLDPLSFKTQRVDISPSTGVNGLGRTISVSPDGEIYVAAENDSTLSVYRMTPDYRFSTVFSLKEKGFGHGQVDLLPLKNGDFLINSTDKGMILVSPEGGIKQFYLSNNFPCAEGSVIKYPDHPRFMTQDQQGRVWVAWYSTPGIFRLTEEDSCFEKPQELPQDYYYVLAWEDDSGNILFAQTSRLLSQAYPALSRFNCLSKENRVVDFSYLLGQRNFPITAYSRDFFKTIFLGLDTGLKIIRNKRPNVKNFLDQDINTDERGASIRGITQGRDGKVYFAREINYWYALNPATNLLDTIQIMDELTGKPIEFSCSSNLYTVADTIIWGASCLNNTVGQLHRYDMVNCTAKTYRTKYLISAFTILQGGNFLLACTSDDSNGGLLVTFNPKTGEFTPVPSPDGDNPLSGTIPRYIFERSNGDIWLATEQGVFVFAPDFHLIHHYNANSDDTGLRLSHNVCYVIYEDNDCNMLLGTENGLNIIDPESNSIRIYRKKDGMASDVVCGIVPDEKGNYWISTYYGLSYLDTREGDFQNFFVADGLSHNEFNRFSFFRGTDGRYYFGGVNGLNAFYGYDLRAELDAPPPLLTKITRYDYGKDQVEVQDTGLLFLDKLVINPQDPYFILQFSLPEFYRSRHHKFWTRLDPLDKEWVYQGANNTVRYNRLSAGNYTLRVAGALANGLRSQNEYTVRIKVKQVFWLRWYVILVILSIASILAYGGFKYRLEQKLEVERLRTKLASDLHDEVSGLLSGMAMQADVLQTMLNGEEKIERVKTIAEVSRKVMDKINDVIWSIDSRKDRLEDLINRMREHADEVLLPLDIRYEMRLEKINQQEKIPPFIRQNLYFIFKETINNVAKHSSATYVVVSMTNKGNFFEMDIQDNGKLPPVNHLVQHRKKSGQGLNNLRMRAERLKAELNVNPNGGYKVSLRMKKFA